MRSKVKVRANSDILEEQLSAACLLTFAISSSQDLSLVKGPLCFGGMKLEVKVREGSNDLRKHLSAS